MELVQLLLCTLFCSVRFSHVIGNEEPDTNTVVTAVGHTATLTCTFTDLGGKTVVWRRSEDVNPLTIGTVSFTADDRISVNHTNDSQWDLVITDVTLNDTGVYECQTTGAQSRRVMVELVVEEPDTNTVVKTVGQTATLTCTFTDLGVKTVVWRRSEDGNPLTIGTLSFTADDRISINHTNDSQWDLVITDVTLDDADLYECQTTSEESRRVTVELVVEEPYTNTVVKTVGQTATLTCTFADLGVKTVVWRRSEDVNPLTIGTLSFTADDRISVNHTNDSQWDLVITDVTLDDADLYECQTTSEESRRVTVELVVEEPVTNTVVKTVGQTATLTCTFTDVGVKMVVWRRSEDENPLTIGTLSFTADDRISVNHTNDSQWDLVITDVTLDDAGVYECQTTGEQSRRVSVELVVEEPYTNTVVKTVGQTATLTCTFTDLGAKTVVWRRSEDENPLTIGTLSFTADDRISVNHTNDSQWDLVITDVTLDDAGVYECQTTGEQSRRVSVELVVEEPYTNTVVKTVGQTATLTCTFTDLGAKTVVWRRSEDMNPLTIGTLSFTADDRISVNHTNDSQWDLVITDVTLDDADLYECQTTSEESRRVTVEMVVEEADTLQVVKMEGQTATLPCTVTDLGPEQVAWRRTDEMNVLTIGTHSWTADDRIHVHHPHDTQWDLVIDDVGLEDAGLYECQSSHLQPRRVTVELVVEAAPRIVGGDEKVSKTMGEDVTLTCHMTGYPMPAIFWTTPDGHLLHSDSRSDERHYTSTELHEDIHEVITRLHVHALEAEDFGFYKCDATNSVGSLRQYVKVTQGRGAYTKA